MTNIDSFNKFNHVQPEGAYCPDHVAADDPLGFKPFDFQKDTVIEVARWIDFLGQRTQTVHMEAADNSFGVEGTPPPIIQLTSGVGSGKTPMCAWILEESLLCKDSVNFVVTPGSGGLANQTFQTLLDHLPANRKVIFLSEDTLNEIAEVERGTVIVTNYEKVVVRNSNTKQYKSRVSREGENYNVWSLLHELRESGIRVNVFVDEAHYGSKSGAKAIANFFKDFYFHLGYKPVRIEITATPILELDKTAVRNDWQHEVMVHNDDIRESGLNRDTLVLNDQIKKITDTDPELIRLLGKDPQSFYLEAAWRRWVELRYEYIRCDREEIPLLAVQVANTVRGHTDSLVEKVEAFFSTKHDPITKEKIMVDNGRFAIRLTENNVNAADMNSLKNKDSKVCVLVYKQAVALGWNCPRAHILVAFRNIISEVFRIQNAGRYLRTTGGQHYDSYLMDNGYIYSDIDNYEVPKEMHNSVSIVSSEEKRALDTNIALWANMNIMPEHAKRTGRSSGFEAPQVIAWVKGYTRDWLKSHDASDLSLKDGGEVKRNNLSDGQMTPTLDTLHFDSGEVYTSNIDEKYAKSEVFMTKTMDAIGDQVSRRHRLAERLCLWTGSSVLEIIAPNGNDSRANKIYRILVSDRVWEIFTKGLIEDVAKKVKPGKENYEAAPATDPFIPEVSRTIPGLTDAERVKALASNNLVEYPTLLAKTHLYGTPAYYVQRSDAETIFEREVLGGAQKEALSDKESVCGLLSDPQSGSTKIVSWIKNGVKAMTDDSAKKDTGANRRHFSICYNLTPDDPRNAYIDYLLLVKNKKGKTIFIPVEVKGDDFEDGSGNESRFLKAKALQRYGKTYGVPAIAVYKKKGVWMAVFGKKDGNLDEVTLRSYWEPWL